MWKKGKFKVLILLIKSRGNSLLKKVYEIFMKTKGFPRDFCENNRFSSKRARDFKE